MEDFEAVLKVEAPAEELEERLGAVLADVFGADVFEQVDPVRMHGWVVRRKDEAAGVYLPEPAGVSIVRIVGSDEKLVHAIVDALTAREGGPLRDVPCEWGRRQSPFG